MKGKTIAMLIGIFAALAAIAALLYHFKDQLCALTKKECKCGKYAEIQEEEPQEEEPAVDSAAEEFKDYADVEPPAEEN